MRIRKLAAIAGVTLLVGGGIWFIASSVSGHSTGAGGLPLIKADANPIKLPPEDPGGEIMPNAESTVFPAIGSTGTSDPSMTNVRMPDAAPQAAASAEADSKPDFAGLRTGFAIPSEPEAKTESLFEASAVEVPVENAPAVEPAPVQEAKREYLTGVAPEDEVETNDKPESDAAGDMPTEPLQQPQSAKVEAAKVEAPKVETPKVAVEAETPKVVEPEPVKPAPAVNAAQALEEQELSIARPQAKPVPPATAKVEAPKKEEPKKAEAKKPEAKKLEALIEQAASSADDAPYVPPKREKAAAVPTPTPAPAAVPAAPAPVAAVGGSGHYIQLASTPAGTSAQDVWRRLSARYGAALAGLSPIYQPAEVPGKGAYVRIQAGPMTQAEANDRCRAVRAVDASGGCLVLRK